MATRGILRKIGTVVTAAGLAVVIGGCAKPQTDAAGSAPPEPSVTSKPTPSPTPSLLPSESPAATPDPVTCDMIFTDEVYAKWEADGLTFREKETVAGDPRLQHLVDAGMTCKYVKPYTDSYAWYAQWPSDEAEWEALRDVLLADGYTEIAEPLPGIIEAPRDPEYKPALVYRDGVVRYASSAEWLGSVRALQ